MNQLAKAKIKLLESDNISRGWKSFHIILLVCVGIFGIFGGIVLSFLYDEDDYLCATPIILKTFNPLPDKHQTFINGSHFKLDFLASGVSNKGCEYTLYTLITSFIFASIWVVFFMMCGRGGKSHDGLPKPWRIVLPALVFSTIMSFTTLGASTQLTVATSKFCYLFDGAMTNITNQTYTDKCEELNLFMEIRQMSYLSIQSIMQLAEAMAWLCMTSWVLSAGLCILRIVLGPDFYPVLRPLNEIVITGGDGYRTLSVSNIPSSSNVSISDKGSDDIATTSVSVAEIHQAPSDADSSSRTKKENYSIINKPSLETPIEDDQTIKKVQFDSIDIQKKF